MLKSILIATAMTVASFAASADMSNKNQSNMITACGNGHQTSCTAVWDKKFYMVVDGKMFITDFDYRDFNSSSDARDYVKTAIIKEIVEVKIDASLDQINTAKESLTEQFIVDANLKAAGVWKTDATSYADLLHKIGKLAERRAELTTLKANIAAASALTFEGTGDITDYKISQGAGVYEAILDGLDGYDHTATVNKLNTGANIGIGWGIGESNTGYINLNSLVNHINSQIDSNLVTLVNHAIDAAFNDGYNQGYNDGYSEGYSDGFRDGVASVQ